MTDISSLKQNTNATIEATIVSISPVREVTTKRGPGRVADATLQDSSGTIVLPLWNEDISKFQANQKVKITDGWVTEFHGKLSIAKGRSGTITVIP
jgi:replication factor A1